MIINKSIHTWSILSLTLLAAACGADASSSESELNSEEAIGTVSSALASGNLQLNSVYWVRPTAPWLGARLFSTAAGNVVLRQLRTQAVVKVVQSAPENGRYKVDHAGTVGWMLGTEMTLRHRYDNTLSVTRINALARARRAMGFSYWWSNARWPTTGATVVPTNNVGTCTGSCPNCNHAATGGTEYGADCSGFVSTIWGFPDFDSDTNPDNNGYSTQRYNTDNAGRWATVPLADAVAGDAVVKYQAVAGGTKHIFLVATARNAAGSFNTYECRGCAQGCMTVSRSIANTDGWHAIRRNGWALTNALPIPSVPLLLPPPVIPLEGTVDDPSPDDSSPDTASPDNESADDESPNDSSDLSPSDTPPDEPETI